MVELPVKREDILTNEIDLAFRSKVIFKVALIYQPIYVFVMLMVILTAYGIGTETGIPGTPVDVVSLVIIAVCVWALTLAILLWGVGAYEKAFIRSFRYGVTVDSLLISSGVFTKDDSTIPFSRIQNIKITNGVVDRKYGLYTAKIETAGFSGGRSAQSGMVRPEGYIPGLRDPRIIEQKIKEQIAKFSKIPSGLEDKVFASRDIAFDSFISYIISKMTDGAGLKTHIAEYRTKKGWSQEKLAEAVGVSAEAIRFLEEGRYNPSLSLAYAIAKILGTRVEDLFEFGG